MNIVYHFFNAETTHHVVNFIKAYNYLHNKTNSNARFVLFNYRTDYKEVYDVFEKTMDLIYIRSKFQMFLFFLRHYLNSNSIFVLHGLEKSFFLINFVLPFRKNQVLWANWGGGLKLSNDRIVGTISKKLRRILYNKIDRINTLLPPDSETLKEKFLYKKNISIFRYFSESAPVDPNLHKRYFSDNKINILVGNHAGKTNKHINWFNALAKFKNDNIRIIVLAGYYNTDTKYVNQFNSIGEKIFGTNYHVFKDLISLDTYWSVMKSVNLLIIDTNHQTGLGAIESAAFYGGHIYLKRNGNNERFMKELGIKTFATDKIYSAKTVNDLLKLDESEKIKNFQIIRQRRSDLSIVNDWYSFLYGKQPAVLDDGNLTSVNPNYRN